MTAVTPTPFQPGPRLIDGGDLNAAFAQPVTSASYALTGTASGTQATSILCASAVNVFSTVASGAGAILPTSSVGKEVIVFNAGSNSLTVFARL